jgi:hypothetical protein
LNIDDNCNCIKNNIDILIDSISNGTLKSYSEIESFLLNMRQYYENIENELLNDCELK